VDSSTVSSALNSEDMQASMLASQARSRQITISPAVRDSQLAYLNLVQESFPLLTLLTTASTQVSTSTNFKGPISSDYETSDTIPFTSTIFSPCGAPLPLNVNSQVRLTSSNSKAQGILTTDSIDGKISFQVGVQWQKC